MREAVPDGGEDDDRDDVPEWAITWAEVGSELLRAELADIRFEFEEAFHEAEEALYGEYDGEGRYSGDLSPEHVYAMRRALNRARERVENEVAPVAGVEPWGDPPPRIPMGVLWELTNHPKAEDVDPREYVEGLEDDDE